MAFRASDILTIINAVTYPIPLTFHAQEILPTHRIFPLCEIDNIKPQSERKKFDVTAETNTFEIHVLVKYNRPLDTETQDLHDIEQSMITLLKNAVLSDQLEISSDFLWARSDIQNNPDEIHGIQSTLRVTIIENKSTSGIGTLGGQGTITIGSLNDMQLLDKPAERETEINEDLYDTSRKRVGLAPITDTHSWFGEVEYTKTRHDTLKTLKRARAVISNIHKRSGVADQTFNGKIVQISNPAPFDEIETIVVQIEILD